jgi:adenosylcobinamide-GDP ribazoletransferase
MWFRLKLEWRYWLLAVGFFTRIPVPALANFQESDLNHAVKYFTLVGWLVGSVSALLYWLAAHYLPSHIAVLLSMIASLYLTGCFHEDGLADAADGLGGGWDKEQVLRIMQDSRIGSYGAAALVMALLAKYALLSALGIAYLPWVLIAGHSLSRYMAVCVIFSLRYVRSAGKAKPLATHLSYAEFAFATVLGVLPMLLLPMKLWAAMLLVLLVYLWFRRLLQRRLGGYTGDCLGAMQQLTEVAFYLAVLIMVGL